MFWREPGAAGWGKGTRQGLSGVIAQLAATAAPPLVTAAAPRELRIDPCEKKKAASLRSRRRGALVQVVVVVGAGLSGIRGIALLPSSPGKLR